jgi:hypothetical protein
MRDRYTKFFIFFFAALTLPSSAFAQIYLAPSSNGGRTKDALAAAAAASKPGTYDKHDFNGIWYGMNPRVYAQKAPPMTAKGQQMFNANKPSRGPRAVVPALGNDPQGICDPLGYPRNLWANNRSFEWFQTPGKWIQTFEWTRAYREILTAGQKVPDDPDPRWYGWSTGKWEGDTFVIDSMGYDERTWIDDLGYPHSEHMKLQERWTRPAYDTLEMTMTLTDPEIYTQPWVANKQTYKLQLPMNNTVMEEAFCVPSENGYFNDHVRTPAGAGKPATVR